MANIKKHKHSHAKRMEFYAKHLFGNLYAKGEREAYWNVPF